MEPINELAAALAKAQGEIQTVAKDANNPFFKSKYASLPAIREAIREPFARHGLSVVQIPEVEGSILKLHTLLLHESGQSLDCGTLCAEVDISNPQRAGSCISYFRRYSLSALAQAVADDESDDDANAAAQGPPKKNAAKKLTGHEVVSLQEAIQEAPTVEALSTLLKGAAYTTLKSSGPADVYEQTSKLAKAKHALLTSDIDQAREEEPKPF